MKYCIHCGTKLEDEALYCQKCGAKQTDSAIQRQNEGPSLTSTSKNPPISYFRIAEALCALLLVLGVILLAVGGFQELEFKRTYDLTGLTEATIDLLRQRSSYSSSIGLMTAGGACAIVGLLALVVLEVYKAKSQTKKNTFQRYLYCGQDDPKTLDKKEFVIPLAFEDRILGDEALFGWQVMGKSQQGSFLSIKYYRYELVRPRDYKDLTEEQIGLERKWDEEFKKWNPLILSGIKKRLVVFLVFCFLGIIGFAFLATGKDNTALLLTGMILVCVGVIPLLLLEIVFMKNNPTTRLKAMERISDDMRLSAFQKTHGKDASSE